MSSQEQKIARLSGEQRARLEAWREKRLQPGFATFSRRTWQRSWPLRRIQRGKQPMTLARSVSKFGGLPYLENAAEWPAVKGRMLSYLGRIEFADMRPHLSPLPAAGLLVMYFDSGFWRGRPPLVCRFYPSPDEERAVPVPEGCPPHWLYESALAFEPTKWLPFPELSVLKSILQCGDSAEPDPVDAAFDWLGEQGRRPEHAEHEVLPAECSALIESVGAEVLQDRTVLLRLDHDSEAGFHWGTNTFYLHIADEDLRSGKLGRVESSGANA